uniref:Uncharacterized protein n=1 Tax=Salix viminalis TaxID=40686 RepID=A0A6N2M2Q5_SALVM
MLKIILKLIWPDPGLVGSASASGSPFWVNSLNLAMHFLCPSELYTFPVRNWMRNAMPETLASCHISHLKVFCQGQWLRRGSPVLHNSTIAAGGKGACLSEPKTRNRNGASLSE